MKVSELTGATLDYWVACAEGLPHPRINDGYCWFELPACDDDPAGAVDAAFTPSTDWSQGGPIIERELIAIAMGADQAASPGWSAHVGLIDYEEDFEQSGPTPLVAAMRAYVASKFGEEVPDEGIGAPRKAD